MVPGAMVSVALFLTYTLFMSFTTPLHVVFVVMSAETVVTVAGYTVFSGSKFAQPDVQSVAGVLSVTGNAPR